MPTKEKQHEISRRQAAACLDAVALFIAKVEAGEFEKETPGDIANRLRTILCEGKHGGIMIPRECKGEAHDPAVGGQIDHCGSCMPHWGWVQTPVKVK